MGKQHETKLDNSRIKARSGEQLEKLKIQREKLNAKIQKIEAMGKQKYRKQDVRRKILIGAYYLDMATKTGALDDLKNTMVKFLKRASDRVLFENL